MLHTKKTYKAAKIRTILCITIAIDHGFIREINLPYTVLKKYMYITLI